MSEPDGANTEEQATDQGTDAEGAEGAEGAAVNEGSGEGLDQGTDAEGAEGAEGAAGSEEGGEEGQATGSDKVIPIEGGVDKKEDAAPPAEVFDEEVLIFETGAPETVKDIYSVRNQNGAYHEKVQGITVPGGVLVKWNGTATFLKDCRLNKLDDGTYSLV